MSNGVKLANLPAVSAEELAGTDELVVFHTADGQTKTARLSAIALFCENAFADNKILEGQFPQGEIGDLSLKFEQAKTTGFYLSDPVNGKVAFVSGGMEAFSYDANGISTDLVSTKDITMTGNLNNALAIGQQSAQNRDYTFEPRELLHLSSPTAARILIEADTGNTDENANAQILFSQDGGATTGRIGFWDGTNSIYVWNSSSEDVVIGTDNKEQIRVSKTGNVGMGGVIFPDTKLHVDDPQKLPTTGNQYIAYFSNTYDGVNTGVAIGHTSDGDSLISAKLINSDTQTGLTIDAAAIRLKTSSKDVGILTHTGRLGIGNTDPKYPVDITNTTRIGQDLLVDGNVEIGTSSPSSKFFVGTTTVPQVASGQTGFSVTSRELVFSSNTNSTGPLSFWRTQSGNSYIASYWNGNSNVGSISVTTSSTKYNTSSDYRLKENVQPMQNALDKVAQLKPVTYTWKADGSDGQGFIAHELAEVCPEAVSGEKDATTPIGVLKDADGTIINEGVEKPEELADGQTWEYTEDRIDPQGIDTSFLVATLTKAIQEQQAQIEALQAEVQALKDKQ